MYSKLHKAKEFMTLACCDEELSGKTIKGNGIEVTINESFFGNEKTGEKKLASLLKKADSINLFGKECTAIAAKKGFIKESDIIKIGEVPHAQIYKI